MLPLQARVDLRAKIVKEYSAFPKAPALVKPHHQIVISRTFIGEVLLLCRDTVSVFCSPSWLDQNPLLLTYNVNMSILYIPCNLSIETKASQELCNILVMWGTIQLLWMLLLRLWRWQTALNWEISSPDTLWVLLAGFVLWLGTQPWKSWF